MSVDPSRRSVGELPVEVTGFVGRTKELAEITAALPEVRLLTLVGPGGVGKSRLALRAVAGVRQLFADGVRVAELSALRDPELLPNVLAGLLGLPERPGSTQLDTLVDYLQDKQLLLVLDTCEHLLDACAMLTDVLLREAPMVTVLATSRQPLDVPGEHTLLIPPLLRTDAVELFEQRAATVVPGFAVTEANRSDVLAMCRRLDGIPLAIELATVRLRALPLDQLVARLEHRFRVLTGSRRTSLLPRHQTLRTTIGWSHELCSPEERLLWARLSVFAGQFDLVAVEEVCADTELPRDEVLEHLISLVDKSVVLRVDGAQGGARYRLLDTIREYGTEWLEKVDDGQDIHRRHRDHWLRLVQRLDERLLTSDQVGIYSSLGEHLHDLRAALEFSLRTPGEERAALGLSSTPWLYWWAAGLLTEGRTWIGRALEQVPEEIPLRARGLLFGGMLTILQEGPVKGRPQVEEAVRCAESCGDEQTRLRATGLLGAVLDFSGPAEAARGGLLLEESQDGMLRAADRTGLVVTSLYRGLLGSGSGDTAVVAEACDLALRSIGPDSGELRLSSAAIYLKGIAAWLEDDPAECSRLMTVSLAMRWEFGELYGIAHCAEALAWVAASQGRMERAAWLLGFTATVWHRAGAVMFGLPRLIACHERAISRSREVLGAAVFERVHNLGGQLPLDGAVLLAQDAEADRPAGMAAVPGPAGGRGSAVPAQTRRAVLTRREREVAELVSEGLSNREIAERLVISKRTADAHVEHILAKLGISSRAEIVELPQGMAGG